MSPSERRNVAVAAKTETRPTAVKTAPMSVKIVIAGGFGVGKTTMVGTLSDIPPLTTEAAMTTASVGIDDTSKVSSKTTTTVAMDFGRIAIDEDMVLFLFGTPGQDRFGFMWDDLIVGALGAVVLVDLRRIDEHVQRSAHGAGHVGAGLFGADGGEVGGERLGAQGIDLRLVGEAPVEGAHLLRLARGGLVGGGLVEDGVHAVLGQLVQTIEGPVPRTVGGDLRRLQPAAIHIEEEIVARLDRLVQRGEVHAPLAEFGARLRQHGRNDQQRATHESQKTGHGISPQRRDHSNSGIAAFPRLRAFRRSRRG